MQSKTLHQTDAGIEGNAQFLREVFPAELQEIKTRRQSVLGQDPVWSATSPPSTELGLVGLAFSGRHSLGNV
jgi:hypothetical protein